MLKRLCLYLGFIFSCLYFTSSLLFANTSNLLQKIELSSTESQNQIILTFEDLYKGTISLYFDSGIIQAGFPATHFKANLDKRVNNTFIRTISFTKENRKMLMQILFADSTYRAERRISHQIDKNKIFITINKKKEIADEGELDNLKLDLLPEKKDKKLYQPSNFSTLNLVKMLLALLLILIFIYSFLWFYKKFIVSKINLKKGKYAIKLSSSFHISPKQKIVILEINDKAYACGVTQDNITVISKVSDESFSQFISNYSVDGVASINFSDLKEQFEQYKSKKKKIDNTVKPSTQAKFSDELLAKVRRLNPID